MKRILFAIAALAVLAAGCMKEQQPETSSDPVNKPVIVVSVAQTKATISPVEGTDQGKCIWQNGDQLAVYYQNSDATAGEIVKFTYSGDFKDGSAKFVAETAPTDGYTPVRVAHPVSSVTETGFSLTTEFTYDASDPDRLPLYLRSENITVNDDGSLSSQLHHNASVLKFTLHDVPAYAAGLAFESVRYKNESGAFVEKGASVASTTTVKTVTRFPYKTGYTADPASSANDVTLYVAAAHSSYPSRVYLIDGDGDEVEGSAKTFNVADGTKWISADDFIEFNTPIDFRKSELRKDYVKVCGVKWAKGNLVYDKNNTYNTRETGIDDNFQTGWGLHDSQFKFISYETASYNHSNDYFDHFNFGGIGRNARFYSGAMLPSKEEFLIKGRVWKGYSNTDSDAMDPSSSTTTLVELEGDDRFTAPDANHYVKIGSDVLCGDVAFWASKGKYRLPDISELQKMSHFTNGEANIQYGYYIAEDVTVYGILYTTPNQTIQSESKTDIEFTAADLEAGLFLPKAGRRGPRSKNDAGNYQADLGNSALIIKLNEEASYMSGKFGKAKANATYKDTHFENPRILYIKTSSDPIIGFSGGSPLYDVNGEYVDNTMSVRAGFSIRPVLVEAAAE